MTTVRATFRARCDSTSRRVRDIASRWQVWARPAVKRGRMVNRMQGEPHEQLRERHDASDFDTKTQDKIAAE